MVSASGPINEVPGLVTPLSYGFNALTASFGSGQIFEISYKNGVTKTYNGGTYNIPDQIDLFSTETAYRAESIFKIMESASDFNDVYQYSGSTGLEGIGFSPSLSGSLAYSSGLFSSTASAYFLSFASMVAYTAARVSGTPGDLSLQFAADVASLPETITTPAEYQQYVNFFETYGTHYLARSSFGGYSVMRSDITASFMASSESRSAAANIGAAFGEAVSDLVLNAQAVYEKSSYLQQYKASIAFSFSAIGGVQDPSLTTYYQSVFDKPVLLLGLNEAGDGASPASLSGAAPEMIPLSTLATSATRQATMEAATSAYLTPSLIDTPVSLALSSATRASADGFLVGWVQAFGSIRSGLNGYTDGQIDPTTWRGAASVHYFGGSSDYIDWSTLTMPVIADDTMLVQLSGDTFPEAPITPLDFYAFISRTAGGPGLFPDAWVDKGTAGFTETAVTDGLLVVLLQSLNDNAHADGFVKVGSDTRGACSVQKNAASDIWCPDQSLCVPILNGEAFTVSMTGSAVGIQSYWLPLAADAATLGTPVSLVNTNTSFKAPQDGFLIVIAALANPGGYGTQHVSVAVAQTQAGLSDDSATVAGVTVEELYRGGAGFVSVRYRTLMLPVSRGMYFEAVSNMWGPGSAMWWVPLLDSTIPEALVEALEDPAR